MPTTWMVPYDTFKYFVKIMQPILNENKHSVINSYTFAQEAKNWEIYQDEVQTSYNVLNSYPSVPVNEAVGV